MGEINGLPRMRTAVEAVEELRKYDSGTAVTVHAVRRMIKSGELPCVHAGKKQLINMQILIDVLNGSYVNNPTEKYGIIRKL